MKNSVQAIKKEIAPVLRRHGVIRAALFGSLARGEERDTSDIDLVVEFEAGRTLLDLVGLRQELRDRLGRDADVVTYDALHHKLRRRILAEQIAIYGT